MKVTPSVLLAVFAFALPARRVCAESSDTPQIAGQIAVPETTPTVPNPQDVSSAGKRVEAAVDTVKADAVVTLDETLSGKTGLSLHGLGGGLIGGETEKMEKKDGHSTTAASGMQKAKRIADRVGENGVPIHNAAVLTDGSLPGDAQTIRPISQHRDPTTISQELAGPSFVPVEEGQEDYSAAAVQQMDIRYQNDAGSLPEATRNDLVRTLETSERNLERSGESSPAKYTLLGTKFNALGRPEDAVRALDRAVQLHPEDSSALGERARAKALLGDKEGSAADARRALKIDPRNGLAQILTGHADTLDAQGRKLDIKKISMAASPEPESLAKLLQAPRLASALPAARVDVAGAPSKPQQPQLSGAPTQSNLLVQSSFGKFQLKDFSAALIDATAAIDADRKNPAAWVMRAEVDNGMKSYPAAKSDAGEALKLAPANAQALRARAFAELQTGDFAAALADANRAIEGDPSVAAAFLYRAMAEEKLGRAADAAADYRRAAQLDPSLAPLAADATAGGPPAGTGGVKSRALFRGGAIAASLVLILLGLLGTGAGQNLTTTAKRLIAGGAGAAPAAQEAAAVSEGTMIGGYLIKGELGRGGMGVVYDGFDETLQRRVAIKQLQRTEYTTQDDLDRFLKEARLVAALKHPNLAQIYTVVNEGDLFLVFEFVDGKPLDQVLGMNRRLAPAAARRIVADVCSALDYAHERKIIHRDLKPGNIMIAKDGSAKVMDFGIAHQSKSATGLTMTQASGTPPYMAPEQGLGSVSKASDIYALAAMTYEMLTGARPFEGPDFLEQKLRKTYVPASRRDPSLPAGVDDLFAAAFEPDPTKRPASAGAFLEAYDRACSEVRAA